MCIAFSRNNEIACQKISLYWDTRKNPTDDAARNAKNAFGFLRHFLNVSKKNLINSKINLPHTTGILQDGNTILDF